MSETTTIDISGLVKSDELEEINSFTVFSPVQSLVIIGCLVIVAPHIERMSKQYQVLEIFFPVFVILFCLCLLTLFPYLDITGILIREATKQDTHLHLTVSQEKITVETDSKMYPTITIYALALFYGFPAREIPLKMITEWEIGESHIYLFRKGEILLFFPRRFLDEKALQAFRGIIGSNAVERKK